MNGRHLCILLIVLTSVPLNFGALHLLCGSSDKPYNPKTHECVEDRIQNITVKLMCGSVDITYNPLTHHCLHEKVIPKNDGASPSNFNNSAKLSTISVHSENGASMIHVGIYTIVFCAIFLILFNDFVSS